MFLYFLKNTNMDTMKIYINKTNILLLLQDLQ